MSIKTLAGLLIGMVIVSLVLPYVGVQFRVLSEIDQAGSTAGWLGRGLIVGLGIVIHRMVGQYRKPG